MVAKVAEDRPKRGQEGPRCAKIEAKRGPKGLRGPLGKPRGGVRPPQRIKDPH